MTQTFSFAAGTLFSELDTLESRNITVVQVTDPAICTNKNELLRFIAKAEKKAPQVLFNFELSADVLDMKVIQALSTIYSSITIPLTVGQTANPDIKNERKNLTKKCAMLNDVGLVFGFTLTGGQISLKALRETMDFALEQYPNHMETDTEALVPTAVLSTQDITTAKRFAHALEAFYTSGRAVPWFLSVLKPLKLRPSALLTDFAEWMDCNNCGISTGFSPQTAPHTELEEMQLAFLKLKYEEKHCAPLFVAVEDIIRLNGAFARASFEQTSTELDLSYTPDELFSPYALSISDFYEQAIMEACSVRVVATEEGPDIQFL